MLITHDGRTQSASAWARELGLTYHALRERLRHWPVERALTLPKQTNVQWLITHDGRTQGAMAWSRELGMTLAGLKARLRRGETIEKALGDRSRRRGR